MRLKPVLLLLCILGVIEGREVHADAATVDFSPRPNDTAVLTVGMSVAHSGSGGGQTYTDDTPNAPSPIRYEAIPASAVGVGLAVDFFCGPGGAAADPGAPWGWWYEIVVVDSGTGATLGRTEACVPLDPENPTTPPPPPPLPRPPSIVEIWRAIAVPAPGLHTSPAAEGVTGLETWLWSDGPTERAVSVTLDGWTLTGTARLAGWSYDPGDGAPAITTGIQGSGENDHAAAYTYEIKGAYELQVAARWEADVTLSGHGIVPRPVDIGTAQLTTTRPYRVVEVRAVLLP